jgi:hypothetical protein
MSLLREINILSAVQEIRLPYEISETITGFKRSLTLG